MTPYIPGLSTASVPQYQGDKPLIKLASNENPLGPACDLADLAPAVSESYPDIAHSPLMAQLAARHHCTKESVLVGNGSDELLQLIALCYLNPKDTVLSSEVTFSEYAFVAQLMDARYIATPLAGSGYDMCAMADAVTAESAKLVFIANPNNPTGTLILHDEMAHFLSQVPGSTLVVLDEAYKEYVTDPKAPDTDALIKQYPNLILLRTFSKLFGLAAFRIGYAVGTPDIIRDISTVRQPFNVNALAIRAAEVALKNQAHIDRSLDINKAGKAYLYDALSQMAPLGVRYTQTEANFICIDVPQPAKDVVATLLTHGLIVRALDGFGWPNAIRVTIGTHEANLRFIRALTETLV
jgi:histidinol-phosphate aminotransferase